jgi:L-lactate dehydrogenase
MKFGKITIIGSGRVGTSSAFGLICQNIAKEVSLLDINEDVLEAECIDLRDAKYFSFTGHVHKGNWEEAKNSQIIGQFV